MKKIKIIVLLFYFILPSSLLSRMDCRDNSMHLLQKYDYKYDHAVACNCQCLESSQRCLKCGHYHEPKTVEVVQISPSDSSSKGIKHFDTRKYIEKLVLRYQKIHK